MSRPPLSNSPQAPKSRKASHLSTLLDRRLAVYALAAGAAAGASTMATAQATEDHLAHVALPSIPLDNTIVYTPANIRLYIGVGGFGGPPPINIDLNSDGVTDLTINQREYGFFSPSSSSWKAVDSWFAPGGAVKRPVAAETEIGPNLPFQGEGLMAHSGFVLHDDHYKVACYGPFANTSGYWGVRFSISGETHYAWIRMSLSCGRYVLSGTISGYAYQTLPDQPIGAGQMQSRSGEKNQAKDDDDAGTLGALSLGSAGLPFWRQ